MGKNFLGVSESLGHFGVFTLESGGEGVVNFLSLLVGVDDLLILGGELNLGFICEDNLDDFVGESE